jgi:hypothetical protein
MCAVDECVVNITVLNCCMMQILLLLLLLHFLLWAGIAQSV